MIIAYSSLILHKTPLLGNICVNCVIKVYLFVAVSVQESSQCCSHFVDEHRRPMSIRPRRRPDETQTNLCIARVRVSMQFTGPSFVLPFSDVVGSLMSDRSCHLDLAVACTERVIVRRTCPLLAITYRFACVIDSLLHRNSSAASIQA